jgi:hypothetical protein
MVAPVGSIDKVELSWEQVASGDFPRTPQQLFSQAVLTEAAKAKAAMPQANGRVERARDLVLGHLVQPGPDNTFVVRSASARGKSYTITNGVCECPDAEKLTDHRCKHLLATWIWRKARKAMADQLPGNGQHPEEPPAPAAATTVPEPAPGAEVSTTRAEASVLTSHTHHEAPASMNCYVDIAGRKVQVTIRGDNEAALLKRMETFLKQFPASEPIPQATAPAEPPVPEGWCRLHDVPMRQWPGKDGRRSWYSHRLDDGTWCKGK